MILKILLIGLCILIIGFVVGFIIVPISKSMRYKHLQTASMQQYVNNYGNIDKK